MHNDTTNNDIGLHIGQLIKDELTRQGRSITWLANQVGYTRENLYKRKCWYKSNVTEGDCVILFCVFVIFIPMAAFAALRFLCSKQRLFHSKKPKLAE